MMDFGLQSLSKSNYMQPLSKVVDTANLTSLTQVCNQGDNHAYIAAMLPLGEGSWLATILTTSASKFNEVRSWECLR